jgi:hypothetical protein
LGIVPAHRFKRSLASAQASAGGGAAAGTTVARGEGTNALRAAAAACAVAFGFAALACNGWRGGADAKRRGRAASGGEWNWP